MNRHDVVSENSKRQSLRARLRSDVKTARTDLRPSVLVDKWKKRQIENAVKTVNRAGAILSNNKAVISSIGIGALLLIGRKPISNLIGNIRKRRAGSTTEQEPL